MDLEYNKIYTFSDLREIFHLPQVQGSKSTSQLSEISKKYLLTKKGRNQYIIERELTELEKIDNPNLTSKQLANYLKLSKVLKECFKKLEI